MENPKKVGKRPRKAFEKSPRILVGHEVAFPVLPQDGTGQDMPKVDEVQKHEGQDY